MRKRNCRVEIYFTKDELESLTKKVRKSGLSRESFCRHLLNGAEIKEAPSADVPMLINEVRRVGYWNTSGCPPTGSQLGFHFSKQGN